MLNIKSYLSNLEQQIPHYRSAKVNYSIFLACCGLIICQSFPWSYKWSGIVSITQVWYLPRGFLATIDYNGLWPCGAENLLYLRQIQAFLGVDGVSFDLGSVFELQRSLYAFIVKSLWFMHPIAAGITVNVLLWMLVCFCMQYVIKTFSTSQTAEAIGAILVSSGQGFLQSVGEISPHVLGYSIHYIILALACRLRLWQQPFVFKDHLVVYATVGLFQLGYDSSWLILPVLFPISLYSLYQEISPLKIKLNQLVMLLIVALLPSLLFSIATGLIIKKGGIILYLFNSYGHLMDLLKTYPLVFLEGILSYGPIILMGILLTIRFCLKNKNIGILYLCLTSLCLFLACTFLMIPVAGRGYVTFSFSAIILLIATYGFHSYWGGHSYAKRTFVVSSLVLYILFNNSPLLSSSFGNNWILQGFSNGYINVFKHPNEYRSFECDAFN